MKIVDALVAAWKQGSRRPWRAEAAPEAGGGGLTLRRAIVLTLVVGLVLPATIGGSLTLSRQQRVLTAELHAEHARLVDILALGMQDPLWNLNHDAGRPLLESAVRDERVLRITVRDERLNVFLEAARPERRRGRAFALDKPVRQQGRTIGTVEVEFDDGLLALRLDEDRTSFLLAVVAQLGVSLALIVLLLNARLLAPIRRLIEDSERLARRELGAGRPWTRDDELGRLGRSLDCTRRALQGLFAEVEARNRELEADVAERRKVEAELALYRDQLEALVEERTKALVDANRELESFSYSVSHDLRAPLRAVDGYSQMLLEDYADKLDADARHYLQRARRATQLIGELIDDMQALSRIGRRELRCQDVDLALLARDVAAELRAAVPGHAVVFDCPGELHVHADPDLMRQALHELLDNAWKFTAGRSGARVEFGRLAVDGGEVHFVRDNGVGFDMAYAGKLFSPFQRLHKAEEYDGTGVGLATVQRIVRRHAGEVWAQAEAGCGATFFFTLWTTGSGRTEFHNDMNMNAASATT